MEALFDLLRCKARIAIRQDKIILRGEFIVSSILRLAEKHQFLVLGPQLRCHIKERMENGGNDVVIQNGVIAIHCFKDHIDPINRLTKNPRRKYAGDVQIPRHFSGQREFTVPHIVLQVINGFLLYRCITGKAVALINDAPIFREIRAHQFEINRVGIFFLMERVLMPDPFERDCPRRRQYTDLILMPIITGRGFDILDLHIEVLVELIIQRVKVLL